MTYKIYGALIASLTAVALMLPSDLTFARSGAAPHAAAASAHPMFRPSIHALRHHRGRNFGAFWPAWPGDLGEPSYGEPLAGAAPAPSGDIHYTYTYDVPWDWAHRFPPSVTPSARPYVPSCPSETVKVPGRDGQERTVNVIRCY